MGRPKKNKVIIEADKVVSVSEVDKADEAGAVVTESAEVVDGKVFNRNVFYNGKEYSTGTPWKGEIPKEIAEYLS